MTDTKPCPFCSLDESRIVLANTFAIAIFDGFPISPGHTLIIPKRHIASLFDAPRDEQRVFFKDEETAVAAGDNHGFGRRVRGNDYT